MKLTFDYKHKPRRLKRATSDAAERIGKRFGAFVMTTARRSIRKPSKNKPISDKGKPPRSQTGVLKKTIMFAYDPASRSVLIGPRILPGRLGKGAPEALEKGGRSTQLLRIGGRMVKRRAKVDERPFMWPALQKREPELPKLWKDAIK